MPAVTHCSQARPVVHREGRTSENRSFMLPVKLLLGRASATDHQWTNHIIGSVIEGNDNAISSRSEIDIIDHWNPHRDTIDEMNGKWNKRTGGNELANIIDHDTEASSSAGPRQRPLATPLTRPALGADSAGAGPDHFVASAMRAGDVHKHVAKGLGYPLGVGPAVGHGGWAPFVRRVVRDDVDQFLVPGPRKIGDRSIDGFLFHVRDFL